MATHRIVIPDYLPPRDNQWSGRHWSMRVKLRRECQDLLFGYGRHVPLAAGMRRRVSLLLTIPPRMRRADPGALWKVLLDALVHFGLLKNDSPVWLELGEVAYERGERRQTTVILEDLEG